MSVIIELNYFL